MRLKISWLDNELGPSEFNEVVLLSDHRLLY